ncbi:conserved hypothetical protein [Trichinella spiralis]|uniref:hypothetical protein n=1 Tax=Trichinella spiralis TaxID=6334 RepID=UPI0001EFC0A0|nr:conserved hypothetical protein [Trichinella spiralis]
MAQPHQLATRPAQQHAFVANVGPVDCRSDHNCHTVRPTVRGRSVYRIVGRSFHTVDEFTKNLRRKITKSPIEISPFIRINPVRSNARCSADEYVHVERTGDL